MRKPPHEPEGGGPSRRRVLPVVGPRRGSGAPLGGPGTPEDDRAGGGGVRPDPARIAEGWEHRFTAAGARAEEMIALYRELGFEVVADPVPGNAVDPGCDVCLSGSLEYRVIYTRRRGPRGDPGG